MPDDQVDILAQLETARTSLATARTELATVRGHLASANASIISLTTERDTAQISLTQFQASVATLTGERDQARGQVATLTASQTDFDRRLATEMAKHGIRPQALSQPNDKSKTGEGEAKLTITEQCIAARATVAK